MDPLPGGALPPFSTLLNRTTTAAPPPPAGTGTATGETVNRPQRPTGPVVLQHLPATTLQAALPLAGGGQGGEGVFSATPLNARTLQHAHDALDLAPKTRLQEARQCLDLLRQAISQPPDEAAHALIDRLTGYLMQLDCTGLSLQTHRDGLQLLRIPGAGAAQADVHSQRLDALQKSLQDLAQLHPALAAPDVQTPAELQGALSGYLDRCIGALQAGASPQALELLAAMEEMAWTLDATQAHYPALFDALRQLYNAAGRHQATQAQVDALRNAIATLSDSAGAGADIDLDADAEADIDNDADADPQPLPARVWTLDEQRRPVDWPEGMLIPRVKAFLGALKQSHPLYQYPAIRQQVSNEFKVSPHVAMSLITAARDERVLGPGLRALCLNITDPTTLSRFPIPHASSAPLNSILDWQQTFADGVRPIPAPDSKWCPQLDATDRRSFRNWVKILWETATVGNSNAGKYLQAIRETLEQHRADQADGRYVPVRVLLSGNRAHDMAVIVTLLNNSNCFATPDGQNFSMNGLVTRRQVQKKHSDIQADILAFMTGRRTQAEFTVADFKFMGYPPSYILKQMWHMADRNKLVRLPDDRYALPPAAPGAQDEDGPAAVRRARKRSAPAAQAAGLPDAAGTAGMAGVSGATAAKQAATGVTG